MNKSLLVSNICTVSLKENIAFVKLLELSLGRNVKCGQAVAFDG